MKFINKLFREKTGATAIEYGLIAALIAVASIVALDNLGDELSGTFNAASTEMSKANGNGAGTEPQPQP